jgi:hypothetical protein
MVNDDKSAAVDGMIIDRGNHFVHHKSHMTWLGIENGRPWREASD